MAKMLIDVDEALIDEAAEVLGTKTKRATVDAAMRVVVAKHARQRLAESVAASGQTPDELDRMARDEAWR